MWGERIVCQLRKNPICFNVDKKWKMLLQTILKHFLRVLFFPTGIPRFYYKKAKVFAYTLEWQPDK